MTAQLSVKQCNAAISQIKITGKGLDEAVQTVGLSVLQHIEANREVSLAIKLLNALPKGARSNALVEWFIRFGMVKVNADKATKGQFPLLFDKERGTNLEGAVAKPWHKCRPERPASEVFDLEAQVKALLKRAAAALKEGKEVKGGAELLAKLQGLGV